MANLTYLFLLFIFLGKGPTSCVSKAGHHILRVQIIYHLPFSNWKTDLGDDTDSSDIFYTDDLVMCRQYYHFVKAINGKPVFWEQRYFYFAYHQDSTFGYTYYPKPDSGMMRGRFQIDSILEKSHLRINLFDVLSTYIPDSSYTEADDDLVNIYNPPIREGDYTDYTLYLYYTKALKGIKETFSPTMDTIKNMKLFRIKIIPKKTYKNTFPKNEILYEMRERPVDNEQEILSYFDKYKKEHLNN